jgi:hypothetical protein
VHVSKEEKKAKKKKKRKERKEKRHFLWGEWIVYKAKDPIPHV